jgi:hypothetical protein
MSRTEQLEANKKLAREYIEEWAADDVASIMIQVGAFAPPWVA